MAGRETTSPKLATSEERGAIRSVYSPPSLRKAFRMGDQMAMEITAMRRSVPATQPARRGKPRGSPSFAPASRRNRKESHKAAASPVKATSVG